MILFRREPLTDELIEDIDAILKESYEKTRSNIGIPPFDFQWDVFYQLQTMGLVRMFTAREDKKLVGAALYIVTEHLHHRGWVAADCDGLWVKLSERGRGIAKHLLQLAEDELKEEGVQVMANKARAVYDDIPLFEKLDGWTKVETTYSKVLN